MYLSLGSNCSVTFQLNKYNKRSSSPFDWSHLSINQLILVLEKDFLDFNKFEIVKDSSVHHMIDSMLPSLVIKNPYNIKFAHEIVSHSSLEDFSKKILTRIENFKLKNIIECFVRIELSPIKKDYIMKIKKLLQLLDIMCGKEYELILILPKDKIEMEKVRCYTYNDYSSDWMMNCLEWEKYFL